jgi:ATP-dependent Clp protease adaptor protein ClpS
MADEPVEPIKPEGQTAVKEAVKPSPVRKPPQPLPLWKVLLHNDDVNDMPYVIETLVDLTPLGLNEAKQRTIEANDTGVALILVTHKERAELYQEQFQSKQLTVTIEPAE